MGSVVVFTFTASAHALPPEPLKQASLNKAKDAIMPHVSVKLFPGRSMQQKTKLAEAIVQDVVKHLECGSDSVSVSIEDVDSSEWREKVYKPEILAKPDKLFKKPGYSM